MLALVFLAAYAPILRPEISPSWKHVCTVTDYVIWVVFVVEFVARVVLAERRGQYVARHVPDVLMVALPVLRPLRLLRFLVLLRMINRRASASLHGRIVVRTGVAGASVTATAHYKTTDTTHTGVAVGDGVADIPFRISRATPGYTVAVDVTATAGGTNRDCSTAFTPQ